jgi:hypothetical protein
MKKSAFWTIAGLCVALVVPHKAIAQIEWDRDNATPAMDRFMNDYNDKLFWGPTRERMGISADGSSRIQKSPRSSTRNSAGQSSTQGSRSGSIVPRMMAAKAPEAKRGDMEKMYSTLLDLYPVSAKRFDIQANSNQANVAAVFVCSNMQVISQQQVSPANCTAVSRQMKRLFSDSNPKYAKLNPKTKRFVSDYMAIVATSMIVMFDGMQDNPNPQMQANSAAQASMEIQKVLGIPGNQLQITSQGLSKK